jgi:hypothetical protein
VRRKSSNGEGVEFVSKQQLSSHLRGMEDGLPPDLKLLVVRGGTTHVGVVGGRRMGIEDGRNYLRSVQNNSSLPCWAIVAEAEVIICRRITSEVEHEKLRI